MSLIGDPKKVNAELKQFRQAARVFSSKRAHLISHYPKKWVAVKGTKVIASAGTLPKLLKEVDSLGVPRAKVMVRYIEKNLRTFIL